MILTILYRTIALLLIGVSPITARVQTNVPCVNCHSPDRWIPLDPRRVFDHNRTDFSLVSAHRTIKCTHCHTGNTTEEFHQFQTAGTNCIDCHQDVHSANLGEECRRCHIPTDWTDLDARELHNGTLFPLTGIHLAVDCEQCHSTVEGQTYTGTPVQCEDCHIEDYHQTTQPSHVEFNFVMTCQDCHFTAGWRPANADHVQFGLLLESIHARMSCVDCHLTYEFIEQDCYQCHQAGYDRGHIQQGYEVSQDCYTCHTTGAWSFGNHDALYFPIYSGEHRGEWDDCTVCHIEYGDFIVFSCGLNGVCHAHNESEMDDEHRGEASGYTYESSACYDCHPDGREDD